MPTPDLRPAPARVRRVECEECVVVGAATSPFRMMEWVTNDFRCPACNGTGWRVVPVTVEIKEERNG